MRSVIVVFFVVLKLLTGCHNYSANVGEALGCTLAGNGCSDPNLAGPVGPSGPQGVPGEIGPEGAAGLTTIQFCPGTPTYPSVFPEVGVCISGNLYAVYSALGGFLTLLPPGRYSSNAIGSRCSFTVFSNCEVGDQL